MIFRLSIVFIFIFSRPFLSNGRAYGTVVVRLSVWRQSVCNRCIVAIC